MHGSNIITVGLLTLVLTACGSGGDGGPAPGTQLAGDDYINMVVGNRWLYEGHNSNDPFPISRLQLLQYHSIQLLDGSPALQHRVDQLDEASYITSRVIKTADSIKQVFDGDDPSPFKELGSLTLLRLPLRIGDRYTAFSFSNVDSGSDVDGDGLNELFSNRLEIAVEGVESVTVPAGTFNNAIRVSKKSFPSGIYSKDGQTWSYPSESTDWYVPSMGIVKTVSHDAIAGREITRTKELSGYRIGDTSTDTTPPTLLSVETRSSPYETDSVILTFSEPMDASSLPSGPFTLQSNSGTSVDGYIFYAGRALTFETFAPLPAGSYSIILNKAQDALGNALIAPDSWSFTIP